MSKNTNFPVFQIHEAVIDELAVCCRLHEDFLFPMTEEYAMTYAEILMLKNALLRKNLPVYGNESRTTMQSFPKLTWAVCSGLVSTNQDNYLVREASQRHADLVFALFTLTIVCYGSQSSAPTMRQLLIYAISLLDQDLTEEELHLTMNVPLEKNPFYPHLTDHLLLTREIYDRKEYSLSSLPVTPFIAFTYFVLLHEDNIGVLDTHRMFKCFEQERINANRRSTIISGRI